MSNLLKRVAGNLRKAQIDIEDASKGADSDKDVMPLEDGKDKEGKKLAGLLDKIYEHLGNEEHEEAGEILQVLTRSLGLEDQVSFEVEDFSGAELKDEAAGSEKETFPEAKEHSDKEDSDSMEVDAQY